MQFRTVTSREALAPVIVVYGQDDLTQSWRTLAQKAPVPTGVVVQGKASSLQAMPRELGFRHHLHWLLSTHLTKAQHL